ncbi:hypothetical protein DICPUDRAFT_51654 [Dictyostelium purpureum]|uniref:Pleckstrin domain-containing protein n=1 Tax=Dictyostelium purpureum TaxID=5786 RepID=F1A4T1_DICPU|nr:uncharacterized protein DICPUDRAFT_51654 [Dictyostelium purpureum]EGC28800.1 hypothetical protein DICPUDRAFT_51654 [Dictyostelium purpureum]|eukprot:XP_003294673.1 hypothetical protein DICPUDRAFT_51654 [Dictyostelium purpureum]
MEQKQQQQQQPQNDQITINNLTNSLRRSNINSVNAGTIVQSCLSFLLRSLSIKRWIEKILNESLGNDDEDSDLLLFGKLMNGVILCKLMSTLKSNSIPKIHTGDTILNFKIRENLCFYIQALDDVGISRHFQFQIADLIEKKNLLKVLESLEVLADDCTDFEKPIEFSDEESLKIHFTEKQISDTEALLKKLNVTSVKRQALKKLTGAEPKRFTTSLTSSGSSLSSSGSANNRLSNSGTSTTSSGSSGGQSVGSRLFQSRIVSTPANNKPRAPLSVAQILDKAKPYEKKWIRIQSLVRGHLARRAYLKRVRYAAYRHNIVKELLATEKVYIENLEHLLSHYFNPMREESSKLNIKMDHFGLLISNLEVIINYNKNLLDIIKPKVDNWSHSQTIGDVFEQFTLYLKVYTQYVKEYSIFFETINNLRKNNSKFEAFIVEKEYSDNYKTVGTYLILPIQRIPRYTLLLTDLVKNTWADHLDYTNLTLSLKKMQEVALYVNEKKREAENIAKVTEIQNNFIGKFENLAEPHRRFVFEGPLTVIGPNGKESHRVFYLFNDVLIGTKPITSGLVKKKVNLKVKESIRMNLVSIRQTNRNLITSERDNKEKNNDSVASGVPTRISTAPKSSSASSLLSSSSTPSSSSSSLSSSTPNANANSTSTHSQLSSSAPSTQFKPATVKPSAKPAPPPRSQATFNVAMPTSENKPTAALGAASSPSNNTTPNSSPVINSNASKLTIGVKPPSPTPVSSLQSPVSSTTTSTNNTINGKPRASTTATGAIPPINSHNQIKQPTPITASSSSSQERLIIEERMKKQHLTIELIDTFGTCILKLLCSSPKEKEQWIGEIKKVYEDLDNKKIINDDAMKRSQERAGLAKAALSQQYATLRVKGRLCDLSTLKTSLNGEEDGSTPTEGANGANTTATGEREFNIYRRQTLSRRSQNPTKTEENKEQSSKDSSSDQSDTDDKKNTSGSAIATEKSKTGTGWFSSLRKKKKHPSIQDTFGLDTSPITPIDNNTTNNNNSSTTTPSTVILKQDNL